MNELDDKIDSATETRLQMQGIEIDFDSSAQRLTVNEDFLKIRTPARIQSTFLALLLMLKMFNVHF